MGLVFAIIVLFILLFEKLNKFSIDIDVQKRANQRQAEHDEYQRIRDEFCRQHSADYEMVKAAYAEQCAHTEKAIEVEQRIVKEAGIVYDKDRFPPIRDCNFVALGILAGIGKIPEDFLEYGIYIVRMQRAFPGRLLFLRRSS